MFYPSRLRYLNDFVEDDINGKIVDDSDYLETIINLIKDKERLAEMSKKVLKNINRF